MMHYLVTSKSMMKKETTQSNQHWHISEEWHLLKKSLRQVFREVFHKKALLTKEMQNLAAKAPPVGQNVEMEESDIDYTDPV
jgi:hypothetical protein